MDQDKLDRIIKGGELLLEGLAVGAKGMQAWANYNAELIALQQKRAAEGHAITQADIHSLAENVRATLADNRSALEKAAAAQQASRQT